MDCARLSPTVAIMQPYFFPYIGYFQLIAAADVFVLYDDVQYIKNGWSNRNRILRRGQPGWLTFPVESGPHDAPYLARHYRTAAKDFILRLIEEAYSEAPHYAETMPALEAIMAHDEMSVAAFNGNLIETLCRHLGIETRIISSSRIPKDGTGQDRVISVCKALGAGRYVNPPGGTHLYEAATFHRHGMDLAFLAPSVEPYRQFGDVWVPGLSIIDVLMFNGAERAGVMAHRT